MSTATLSMRTFAVMDKLRLLDGRGRGLWKAGLCLFYFGALLIAAITMGDSGLGVDFAHKKLAPCLEYPFGTRLARPRHARPYSQRAMPKPGHRTAGCNGQLHRLGSSGNLVCYHGS